MHPQSTSREIPLSQGKVAIVDAADYEWLSQFRWYASHSRSGGYDQWYARRSADKLLMHRLLVATSRGVDHINHDGLDNRRANLRPATQAQNGANGRQRRNASGYRGVTRHTATGKWQATISVNRTQLWLGSFVSPEDAARAYDAAARAHYGEFATLNGV